MRKVVIRLLGLGALVAVLYAAWRAYSARTREVTGAAEWENAPFPFPPVPRPVTPTATVAREPWVDPVDGDCPSSHPVKAKLTSGIYHVPGGMNYARTHPDRCYVDADAAERDGLRPSKM
jgi:hypothetical protein